MIYLFSDKVSAVSEVGGKAFSLIILTSITNCSILNCQMSVDR